MFQGVDPAILKNILQESGLKYKQTSISYVFNCPKCNKKDKLYIRKRDGRFVCWYCREISNFRGRPEFALAALLNEDLKVVSSRLYGGSYVPVDIHLDVHIKDFLGDEDEFEEEIKAIPIVEFPHDYYELDSPKAVRGVEYLRSRGIPLWMAKQYNIRYCPVKRRVVFPVDNHGKLYGWQERLVIDNHWVDEKGVERTMPKILSSTGIPRDRTLMFSDRLQGLDYAVLCEGPFDAIKCHFIGGNICAMGKAVSVGQINLLLLSGIKKLYLALDPDAANEIGRLVSQLNADVELYEMVAKGNADKPDLGAMAFDEVYELYLNAKPVNPSKLFYYLNPKVRAI